MKISQIELLAGDPHALGNFYSTVLELPVREQEDLTVEAGETRLVFRQAPPGWEGYYHFAFNVPENCFDEAKRWLAGRVPLIADTAGKTEFDFQSWNAHSIYFYDPAGNILEFISRHGLPNASDQPFSARGILNASEIGIATSDVISTVQGLRDKYGFPVYGGEGSDQFTAVGDEHGLMIVVRLGRTWFPDTGKPAGPYPVKLTVQTPEEDKQEIDFDFGL